MPEQPQQQPDRELIEGLSCPKCRCPDVERLPSNAVTPHPGYRCVQCGLRMRGMTWTYILVIVLGVALLTVAVGLVKIFSDDRDGQLQNYVLYSLPLSILVVGFSVFQLLKPRPARS